jgi:hypothetical protein
MEDNNDITNNSDKEDKVDISVGFGTTACQNCEEEYELGFAFCPYCGQKTNEDLTVSVLFYNTISNYFSFDARFFKSFIPLMFRPGLLAKRFIAGKRLLYLHPAQMYLFISVVFFFLFSSIVRDQVAELDKQMEKGLNNPAVSVDSLENEMLMDSVDMAELSNTLKDNKFIGGMNEDDKAALDSIIKVNSNSDGVLISKDIFGYDSKKVDSLIAAEAPVSEQLTAMGLKEDDNWIKKRIYNQLLKFQTSKKGGSILQSFYDSIPIALFVLLPIFAMILKLFFWRRGAFAHHLVFSFYYYSFLFTVFSIILLTNRLIWEIPDAVSWLIVFSTFFYLFLAIKHFYRQGYFLSFFKTCVVTFVYMTFVLPIAAVIMFVVAFMFY